MYWLHISTCHWVGGGPWLLNMYVYKFKDDISTLQTLNNVTEVTLQLNDKDVELHWFHGI